MTGFSLALEEITLVLFTTLAPAGAVAYILLALASFGADQDASRRIQRFLLAPLMVVLVGLVASATHLGNPENALYVLSRVGQSPLSTEVAAAVVFLGIAGVQWMYQYAERYRRGFSRGLLVAASLAALGMVAAIAFAYASRTVLSWNTAYVPLLTGLNAAMAGPLLALAVLVWAQRKATPGGFGRALLVGCIAALGLGVVVYLMQGECLADLENTYTTAMQLVPHYSWCVVAYGVLGAVAWGLDAAAVFRRRPLSQWAAICACLLALLAVFVMRCSFYAMHLTVGMGW